MRKFKIIPISHSLKGNKIAKSNDVVTEDQLTSPAVDLISAGFIEEVFEDVSDIQTQESEEVVPLIPADVEEENNQEDVDFETTEELVSDEAPEGKEEVFEDAKKEIKDIKKPVKRN